MEVPGDKSISHRAIILGSIAAGTTTITNFLASNDCMMTVAAFEKLGVKIERDSTSLRIVSKGHSAFIEPNVPLYLGNSGTTARLLMGVLAGLPFYTVIYGDPYLSDRPMDRVTIPLQKMGAQFDGREKGRNLPLSIRGNSLAGITYKLPIKSAQVKSAILLSGLFAQNNTTIIEKTKTRDHTENMLQAFGAHIETVSNKITVKKSELAGTSITIPGDISSAAFFLVAAAIVPRSKLTIKKVGLNPTRTGIIDVLLQMGANIVIDNEYIVNGEHMGNITITQCKLFGTTIKADIIPRLIDEIPVIALLASQAEGKTIIQDAEELRVKETDRIEATISTLKTLGVRATELDDGMIIYGKSLLTGGSVSSFNDHRIAMMAMIASLVTTQPVIIDDIKCVSVSYPNFLKDFKQLTS